MLHAWLRQQVKTKEQFDSWGGRSKLNDEADGKLRKFSDNGILTFSNRLHKRRYDSYELLKKA